MLYETIEDYRNAYTGWPCCILGNGESVNRIDLNQINVPVFGLNKAWLLRTCAFYVIGDKSQFEFFHRTSDIPLTELPGQLFALEDGPNCAIRIKTLRDTNKRALSFDLTRGIYPNNTVAAFAIQLALWMGFYTIYLVGIDAQGAHFDDNREIPARKFANQREAYGYIAGILDGMNHPARIINLSPETRVYAFEKQKFEFVFGPKARNHRPRILEPHANVAV